MNQLTTQQAINHLLENAGRETPKPYELTHAARVELQAIEQAVCKDLYRACGS